MVLVANNQEEIQHLVEKVKVYCDKWLLKVNVYKTKVVGASKDGKETAKVKCKQSELECVPKYCY